MTAGTLPAGQTLTVTVAGSQTAVGSSANTISSAIIRDAQGNNVSSNYTITIIDGALTVTPAPVIAVVPPPAVPPAAPPAPPEEPEDPPAPPTIIIPDVPQPFAPPPFEPEEDEPTEIIIIGDPEVPLAPFSDGGSWALWNLILSIAGAILAIMMGIRVLIKKRRQKEEDEELEGAKSQAADTEDEDKKRSRLLLILLIPFLAIIGIILFILTQDMRQPMIMIDWWTLAHVILFAGGIISYIFAYRTEKDEDNDEEQPANAQHTQA